MAQIRKITCSMAIKHGIIYQVHFVFIWGVFIIHRSQNKQYQSQKKNYKQKQSINYRPYNQADFQ